MTGNEKILNNYIRHQIYMLKFANGLHKDSIKGLIDSEKPLYRLIIEWIEKLNGSKILIGRAGKKWQKDFFEEIFNLRNPAWQEISKNVIAQLQEFAVTECDFVSTVITDSVPVHLSVMLPPVHKIIGIVNSQPLQGRVLKKWLEKTAYDDINRIVTLAKIGIVQGETPTSVAKNILGLKSLNFKDSKSRRAFQDLESVLLTVTNGVQHDVRSEIYKLNSDIIKNEIFVATLDSRVTMMCAGNDGNVFKLDKGPKPPLHFRCRSLRAPYINPKNFNWRGFDTRAKNQLLDEFTTANNLSKVSSSHKLPKGYKTKFASFYRSKLNTSVGQVPATVNYNDWLKERSPEFQNEVLGKSRAKIFREGKISLDKFLTSDKYGVLSLKELKDKGFLIPD